MSSRRPPARSATIRQLLAHAGGLPAWVPLYTYGSDPATLEAFVLQRLWPKTAPIYSDLGFILLGILAAACWAPTSPTFRSGRG